MPVTSCQLYIYKQNIVQLKPFRIPNSFILVRYLHVFVSSVHTHIVNLLLLTRDHMIKIPDLLFLLIHTIHFL